MAEPEILEGIRSVLLGVDGITIVHNYKRWAATWSDLLAKFKTADERFHAWNISRISVQRKQHTLGEVEQAHTFEIIGIYGLQDDVQSERAFQALVDRAVLAFDADETLGGTCESIHPDWGPMSGAVGLQVDKIEPRAFGSVLCHVAQCRICAIETILV